MIDEFDPREVMGIEAAYAPERLQLMGQIALDWNLSELALQMVWWRLAGLDYELGECVTVDLGNISLKTLCSNTLARFHEDAPYKAFIEDTLKLFEQSRQARNFALHHSILPDATGFVSYSKTMKGGKGQPSFKIDVLDNEALEVFASAIGYLVECLNICMKILDDEHDPSPDKRLLPVYTEILQKYLNEIAKPLHPPRS